MVGPFLILAFSVFFLPADAQMVAVTLQTDTNGAREDLADPIGELEQFRNIAHGSRCFRFSWGRSGQGSS